MAIRTSVGALLSITILFVGVYAISESAQQHQASAGSDAEQAGQMAEQVFGTLTGAGGQGIVWMGVAAVVLVAVGLLVASHAGGGR